MRKFFRKFALAAAFTAGVAAPLEAQRDPDGKPARYAATVIDAATGNVLYSRDGQQSLYPASTTKIMTAYLIFEDLRAGKLQLGQRIPMSANAASREPTNIASEPIIRKRTVTRNGKKVVQYVKVGQRQTVFNLTIEEALKTMLVHSANDAAVALAEASSGSEAAFVARMNATAERLGMTRTTFKTPNGLPNPAQRTTVEDMAKLGLAAIKDFPEYYPLFNTPTYLFRDRELENHNRMLGSYAGMDGLKTGYTRASGFNMVASATRDNQRVVGVVFGTGNPAERQREMTRLLDFGFIKLADPFATFTPPAKKGPAAAPRKNS